MWRSYNLGRRIVRLRVQHLLSDYGWLTYPNSPVAPIKSYSGYRGYALVLIVSEPFPLWRAQLEMSVIKNSALLPLTGNGGARFFTHSSWHLLRGAEGVEGWSTHFFPSLFSVCLCITAPLKQVARLWSVYPRLCQSKPASWRLHSSALQYLCLLPCLRFLMTELS